LHKGKQPASRGKTLAGGGEGKSVWGGVFLLAAFFFPRAGVGEGGREKLKGGKGGGVLSFGPLSLVLPGAKGGEESGGGGRELGSLPLGEGAVKWIACFTEGGRN